MEERNFDPNPIFRLILNELEKAYESHDWIQVDQIISQIKSLLMRK